MNDNIIIQGRDLKLHDNIEAYARGKLEKLYRYLPRIMEIRMDIGRQVNKRSEDYTIVQITVRHERGALLRVEERLNGFDQDTLLAAVNQSMDKMLRRVQRFKGKRQDRRRAARFSATVEELESAEDLPEEIEEGEEAEPVIVRRKQITVSPMNEQEAIEQMELLGHTFFVFMDEGSRAMRVLYKRANGDYGVLVPETA